MNAPCFSPAAIERALAIVRSFRQRTGRDLIPIFPSDTETAHSLFQAPFVVVAHGAEEDPLLNYANQAALDLWEMSWQTLVQTPSRLTAEPVAREERARLLKEVTRRGFIAHYAGVRISRSGRRFRITGATVWNVDNAGGQPDGQAATFNRWEFL